ncbi:MAG TPA: HEAT repeat domain-containing protein [Terracidiphilus sp.]|jgi:anti-sigma factor RsiW|nr:HEAT repeat domain-containing protein [Terracidiphilus sp.]
MNCELAQERIVTAAYGELADEQAHELERHVAGCERCGREREQVLLVKAIANLQPVQEPAPNLVARARLRLEEALDALPPKRWYERFGQRMVNNFASLQSAPVAAILLLVVGAGAGCLGQYEYAQSRAARAAVNQAAAAAVAAAAQQAAAPTQSDLGNVAGVSAIVHHSDSGMVDVSYNQLVPRRMEGTLDDPQIRQLLMLATEDSTSAGIRDDSVALLAAECRAGHSCPPSGIRDALMVALRYDKSPQVRAKALEGLQPYVAEDMRVRDAVLEALMNDRDPQIRSNAISLLEPVEADTSVRQVLYSVSNSDDNPQIRNVSRQVLSQVPEIQ